MEEYPIDDQRRRPAAGALPLADQAGVAAGVDHQLDPRQAATVGDEGPGIAVGWILPDRQRRQHASSLRDVDDGADLAAGVPWSALAAQVVQVDEPQLAVLAALHGQMREAAGRRRRQEGWRGAADVGIGGVERLEVGRCVAVQRIAVASGSVGVDRQDAVGPSVIGGIVAAVPGGAIDPIGAGVVDHADARPEGRPAVGAVRGPGRLHERHGLVAALGVERTLRGVREIDGGDVPLIVAVVARIATMGHVKVSGAAARRGEDQRRRSFLVEGLRAGEHRPATGGDLRAGGDGVLVDAPFETIAVDELPARIDGG